MNKSKIWTLLGKEEQVEDMNPPWTKGEQVDDIDPSSQVGTTMMIHTFLARRNDEDMDPSQKGETSRRYGPISKRRNMLKIWTLLGKEKQVEDMESFRKGGTGRRYGLSSERKNKSKI